MTVNVEGIEMRLAAVPGGEWRSALGSGHSAMTAVVADIPDGEEDYETVFICDVIPDYCVEDPQVWENRVLLLNFIQNAPTDMRSLLAIVAAKEAEIARIRGAAHALYDSAIADDDDTDRFWAAVTDLGLALAPTQADEKGGH